MRNIKQNRCYIWGVTTIIVGMCCANLISIANQTTTLKVDDANLTAQNIVEKILRHKTNAINKTDIMFSSFPEAQRQKTHIKKSNRRSERITTRHDFVSTHSGTIHYPPEKMHVNVNTRLNEVYRYIEIDTTLQMMYVYVDQQCVFSAPIVSGKSPNVTPSGVFSLSEKAQNVILKGRHPQTNIPYAQSVQYWLVFNETLEIGLHDATWQEVFGGDQYQLNGSLGCVQLSKKDMARLFSLVHVGTIVYVI